MAEIPDTWEEAPEFDGPVTPVTEPNQTVKAGRHSTKEMTFGPSHMYSTHLSGQGSDNKVHTLESRPEKSNRMATRLIAGALGLKCPKPEPEHKKYDHAIESNLRKKKEIEVLKTAEAEKMKADIWDA